GETERTADHRLDGQAAVQQPSNTRNGPSHRKAAGALRAAPLPVLRVEGPAVRVGLAIGDAGVLAEHARHVPDQLRTCLTDAVPGCCTCGVSLARRPVHYQEDSAGAL